MTALQGMATKPTAVQSRRPKHTAVPAPAQLPATSPAQIKDIGVMSWSYCKNAVCWCAGRQSATGRVEQHIDALSMF